MGVVSQGVIDMKNPIQAPPVMPYEQRAKASLYATCQRCGAAWLACELPASAEIVRGRLATECGRCMGTTTTIEVKAI